MENQADICKDILDDFIDRWTVDEVKFINYVKKNLTLDFSYESIDL
jgi:hypothetical protein